MEVDLLHPHPEAAAFLRKIAEHPGHSLPALVYADWLDEQSHPTAPMAAELIRLAVEKEREDGDRWRVEPHGWLGGKYSAAIEWLLPHVLWNQWIANAHLQITDHDTDAKRLRLTGATGSKNQAVFWEAYFHNGMPRVIAPTMARDNPARWEELARAVGTKPLGSVTHGRNFPRPAHWTDEQAGVGPALGEERPPPERTFLGLLPEEDLAD
jgi:uncharacterized protein (TIGR02996 family)